MHQVAVMKLLLGSSIGSNGVKFVRGMVVDVRSKSSEMSSEAVFDDVDG